MMSIDEATQKAEELGIEIEGNVVYDPYQGWIDDAPGGYGGIGFCILCELNIEEGFCTPCQTDEEPCHIFE
jgi:hypothetical protein